MAILASANRALADLAHRTGLPLIDASDAHRYAVVLDIDDGRLAARASADRSAGAVVVDFAQLATRRPTDRSQPLARALGVGRGVQRIVDATAGLGRDAFGLARLGCQVTLVERSPVVAALLADGLGRALSADAAVAAAAARLTLVERDAVEFLADLASAERPDAIYLDPMFVDRGKRALAKKEMQLFRALLDDAAEDEALLDAARRAATRRVVVKRHARSRPIARPDGTVAGRAIRFDIYTPRG